MRRTHLLTIALVYLAGCSSGSNGDETPDVAIEDAGDVVDGSGVLDAGDAGAAVDMPGAEMPSADMPVDSGSDQSDVPTASVDVVWKVDELEADGDGCAAIGADTVELVARPSNSAGDPVVPPPKECDAGGAVWSLPTGEYDLQLTARDDTGEALARSATQTIDADQDGEVRQVPRFGFLSASFELAWTLSDSMGGIATCDEAAVETFEVRAVSREEHVRGFSCPAGASDGEILTGALPLGEYEVTVSALGNGASVLARESVTAVLNDHATTVDVGLFEFNL